MTLNYPAVVIREKKGFWAYVPDLPGVYGMGSSRVLAKRNLVKALKLYIEDCRADGDAIPRSAAKIVEIDEVTVSA